MSTIVISPNTPNVISVEIPSVNTITITPPEVRTVTASINVGTPGDPGPGVNAGGSRGMVLTKIGNEDYETDWRYPTKIFLEVRNDESFTLDVGDPVYPIGEIGGSGVIRVGLADASDSAKMPAIGVIDSSLAAGADGSAVINGIIESNFTPDGTPVTLGDVLYVKPGGGITTDKPTNATELIQNLGIAIKTGGSNVQGFQVSCIGRTNDIPNLATGKFSIGGVANQISPYTLPTTTPAENDILIAGSSNNLQFASSASLGANIGNTNLTISETSRTLDLPSTGRLSIRNSSNQPALTVLDSLNVGVGTLSPSSLLDVNGAGSFSGDISVKNGRSIKLYDGDSSNYAEIKAPSAIAADYTLTLPADDGNVNDVLTSDGSGNLSWAAPVTDTIYTADGTLSGNRAIELNGNYLELTQGGTSQVKFFNTGTTQINNRLTIDGDTANSSIRMWDNGNSNAVTISTPSSMSGPVSVTLPTTSLTFPTSAGSAGQYMTTDGAGNLSFTNPYTFGGGTWGWNNHIDTSIFNNVSASQTYATLFYYQTIAGDSNVNFYDTTTGPSVTLGDIGDATYGAINTIDINNVSSGKTVAVDLVMSVRSSAGASWYFIWNTAGSPYATGLGASYIGGDTSGVYQDISLDLGDLTVSNHPEGIKIYAGLGIISGSIRWRLKELNITIS